jgi:hypothetical protein
MSDTPQVRVLTSGGISAEDAELARRTVSAILSRAGGRAPAATVVMTVVDDPDLPRPALVRATIEDGMRTLHAQAAAAGPREAVELLETRLNHRMALVG